MNVIAEAIAAEHPRVHASPVIGTDGHRNYAAFAGRAPLTCGTCGAVSSHPCYHERPLAKGDRVRVQLGQDEFTGTVQVIVTGEFDGLADVRPDDVDAVISVPFGPAVESQGTPMESAA